ncbi:major Facilitator Superfamily protein [Variibacter gotjawalensis]|uniref:Major Facilitator Superfamily protein n=1 Tax=Variibacter gotjawalensis TaxID=1333996 RepID=A0A0S3PSE6_9BRAD|nr:MFS transporter [Variibacter gotjawalensis]NIK49181.1 MFS family permease [Variibacter gotjawalensis]RZS51035.1 cyanate permease [Variibacter gotjawalensis]BAT58869.1 major Facilitator Superfamily protein [Variibacter gotjawalensis]
MSNRWGVLLLLFVVRLSMAFQFQSVASMSPALMAEYKVGLGEIGLLISLYLAPGLAFALPGGEIGRRFGDKRVVLFGLVLMTVGGLIMASAPSWGWQVAGRLCAGAGGVLLNVLMSKMVTDWFAGKEIATAMAIFVNSWPAGIALCLLVVPAVTAAYGISAAVLLAASLCIIGFALLAILYRAPAEGQAASARSRWPAGSVLQAIIAAGVIWGLFNAAIGMVFSFGTPMLVERGWSLASAGSATSLVLWLVTLSVPLGGYVADRTGKHVEVMLVGFVLFAIALVVAALTTATIPAFVALGLFGGLSAGSIMSLPARVLTAEVRAVGMGVFFTLFYAICVIAPIVAGVVSSRLGTAAAGFFLGAAMLVACLPCYWIFRQLAARSRF